MTARGVFARRRRAAGLCVATLGLMGCYFMRPSSGGGQTKLPATRSVRDADVLLPDGFRIEAVATGLTFPTGVVEDGQGRPHVVESGYCYGEVWTTPRLLRIEAGGEPVPVASGGRNGPWNGVAFHEGAFFVAEGGVLEGGRILRITPEGRTTTLVSGLPSQGDHHTNGPAIGPDGRVYFGQGTATNSAVVGTDNASFGWLARNPRFHDVPCQDVILAGRNFRTDDPLPTGRGRVSTGAFSPLGVETRPGQRIEGRVPCSGAVLRVPPDGGEVELVAWGFRNPFGLAFSPDGRLYLTDNAYDDRGSRPVWGSGDLLWEVRSGLWYGWPDFSGDRPLDDEHFRPPGGARPAFLLEQHPNPPPRPVAVLGVHSSSNGLDFSRSERFGWVGDAFVAQFGDQAPAVGSVLAPVGFKVVRVEVARGVIHEFAVNRGRRNGPASLHGGGGLERPVAVRFSRDGESLWVVDFGVLGMDGKGAHPVQRTGVLWRITRERS